jgi:hypothetical protein
MNYVVEMYSGAVIYTSGFMKIGSGVQTLIEGFTDSMEIAEARFWKVD